MLPAAGKSRIGVKLLSMDGLRSVPSLVRLGLIVGSILIAVVLLVHVGYSSTTISLAARSSAHAVARVNHQAKLQLPATSSDRFATAIASDQALAGSSVQLSNSATVNIDLRLAEKLMVPAPPQTDLALQGVDPRRLRASFQRGMAVMRSNDSDTTMNQGAELVGIAAVLGYEPARVAIVQQYPRSSIIRSAVSSAEAVRYSLDPLFIPGPQSESGRIFLVLLASFFSGRHELSAYATDLLATLSDDRRLQTADSLKSLLGLLARVPGACTALSQAAVKARTVTGPECSPGLQLQLENFIRLTAPAGLEARSRRQALRLLGLILLNASAS
jgi:hypothetical protein